MRFHEGNVKKLSNEFYASKLYKLAILHLNTGHHPIRGHSTLQGTEGHVFFVGKGWLARRDCAVSGLFCCPPLVKTLLHEKDLFSLVFKMISTRLRYNNRFGKGVTNED